MKRIVVLTACWLLIAMAHAADAPKPPVISDALQKRFFKAQSEVAQAQAAAKAAQDALQAKASAFNEVGKEIQDVCGKEFNAQLDKDGWPSCVKPEPKK